MLYQVYKTGLKIVRGKKRYFRADLLDHIMVGVFGDGINMRIDLVRLFTAVCRNDIVTV